MIYLCLIPLGVGVWFSLIGWALASLFRGAGETGEDMENLHG